MKIAKEYDLDLRSQIGKKKVVFKAVGNNTDKALRLVASALIVASCTLISKALKSSK